MLLLAALALPRLAAVVAGKALLVELARLPRRVRRLLGVGAVGRPVEQAVDGGHATGEQLSPPSRLPRRIR